MDGLLEMLKDSFSYFDSLVCLSLYQPISSHQYSWCLGYALASMWVIATNSRTKSIERMTMKDYKNIKKNNFFYHLTSKHHLIIHIK